MPPFESFSKKWKQIPGCWNNILGASKKKLVKIFSRSENEKAVLCLELRELSTKDISADVEFWFQSKASKAEKECYFWFFSSSLRGYTKKFSCNVNAIVVTSFRHVNKFRVICLFLFYKNLFFTIILYIFKWVVMLSQTLSDWALTNIFCSFTGSHCER